LFAGILSKFILASIDFIGIFFPFFFTLAILHSFSGSLTKYLPHDQFDERVIIHLLLGIIGVAWFWMRLRHYTYRKPFWFELKEILRTLSILAVLELAVIAFSKLDSSRNLWLIIWIITFVFMPTLRVVTKKILIKSKKELLTYYQKEKQKSFISEITLSDKMFFLREKVITESLPGTEPEQDYP